MRGLDVTLTSVPLRTIQGLTLQLPESQKSNIRTTLNIDTETSYVSVGGDNGVYWSEYQFRNADEARQAHNLILAHLL